MEYAIYIIPLLLLPLYLFFITRSKPSSKKLPPGSLGFPIIGQSLSFLKAMRTNRGEEWLYERVRKYGPIFKLHLLGTPAIFLKGQPANKFVYTCSQKILSMSQPASQRRLVGERNIAELSGEDHKRMRGAFMAFLKPEVLKLIVGRIDEEIRIDFQQHWDGKKEIVVMPLMKNLVFGVICSVILGVEAGARRDTLLHLFEHVMEGFMSIPINLPFTCFNQSIRARSKIRDIVLEIMREKREKLENNEILSLQDLITSLLSMRSDTNSPLLTDEEIVDNITAAMIAGHDTTAIVLTFLIKLLAENSEIYKNVLNEQEEIAKGKGPMDLLTWEDLAKMKYTWGAAKETMRINPPAFVTFRTALQDIEFEGYVIPKGWKVVWAQCMTHMDESIYPNPTEFDPSRYENQAATPPFSFVAFGGGPRMCPGYELARIETLVTTHYLVTRFRWKLALENNFFVRDPLPVFKEGLPIHIEPKKPICDEM